MNRVWIGLLVGEFQYKTRDRSDYLVDRYSERNAEGRVTHGSEHAAAAMSHEQS